MCVPPTSMARTRSGDFFMGTLPIQSIHGGRPSARRAEGGWCGGLGAEGKEREIPHPQGIWNDEFSGGVREMGGSGGGNGSKGKMPGSEAGPT